MCFQVITEEERMSIRTYTNKFGVTTVHIDYGPIRFSFTSRETRPIIHRWKKDNGQITIVLNYPHTGKKLLLRFLETVHKHRKYQHRKTVINTETYFIPVLESEWGRSNWHRSELVLVQRPMPDEVYNYLLSDILYQQTFRIPVQETQPLDNARSEPVLPRLVQMPHP